MVLCDDDNEFLRQLAWIYPTDYIAEIRQLAEAVVKEQMAAGERQNIRDIVWAIMAKIQAEADGTVTEAEQAAIREAQAAVDREVRALVLAALDAGQPHIPAGMGPEGVRPLIEALTDDRPELAVCARSALNCLTDSGAIDALCAEWAKSRSAELEQAVLTAGYLASQPLGLRLLTVLKTGASRSMLDSGPGLVPELLLAVDDNDQCIARRARRLLLTLTDRRAIDAVCEAVLASPDDIRLKSWAIMARYAPANGSRAAFYYAATGQWDHYYALDWQPKRPLLTAGYSEAGPLERERFRDMARQSGQSLLLAELLLAGGYDECREITVADWEAMLDVLVAEERWPELYRLGFNAPVEWAAEIALLLTQVSWQPQAWQCRNWARTVEACPESGKTMFVPDSREVAVLALDEPGVAIDCVAFHPGQKIVAGGGRDGCLRLWQINDRHIWRTVNLHTEAITALAFTPDGRYLATAGREGKAHIWRLPDVKWAGSVSGQPGLVTAMAADDSGRILAAAGESGGPVVRVWQWDGVYMSNQGHFPGSLFGVAAVNSKQRLAAGGGRDGKIRVYALTGSKRGNQVWAAHDGTVEALALSGDGKSAVSTGADGLLKVWQVDGGKLLLSMPHSGCLKAVSHDGALAAAVRQDQGVIVITQLKFVKPLSQATHADWQHTGQLLALPGLTGEARQAVLFLHTLLAGKFCYDIML